MTLQHTSDKRFNLRVQAVKEYLKLASLESVAASFNIHPITLRKWVKRYQNGGKENLKTKRLYRRHLRRFAPAIEKKIVMLKEQEPYLTFSEAQNILDKNGIKISINGIWNIWKRYNLAGFHRQGFCQSKIGSEIKDGLRKADQALNQGDLKKAAQILNALPSCADNEILKRVPDRFLSLQRQVEKLDVVFHESLFHEVVRKAKTLRERAEKKNLFYTSVRAGLNELLAMDKIGNPEKQLDLAQKLLRRLEKKGSPGNIEPELHFLLLTGKAKALADLGRIKDVLLCIKKCEDLCRHSNDAKLCRRIAFLYSAITYYKKSRHWIEKSLGCSGDQYRGISYEYLAANLTMAGEYRTARKTLKGISMDGRGTLPLAAMINACCSLGEGKIQEAIQYANEALLTSRKSGILDYLLVSSLILVYCSCGFNERTKAISQLERLVLQIKKFGSNSALYFVKALLGHSTFSHDVSLMPNIKLTFLLRQASTSLKITDYRKAYKYATSHQLIGLFHRLVFFFPELVDKVTAKGKPTKLPRGLLKLPVFQKNIPVYHLKFLGPVYIHRNGVKLRHDPTPIYASSIIHFSLKKKIELELLYKNFWSHSRNPSGSLSHLLFGLRKHLRLPPNTLFIKERFLHFKGYITTDYQEFEQTLTRAKALERAGEWGFARKEYLRAFSLFRGEPFKKMYDPWSEYMRRVILNELEDTTLEFAKSCLAHKNKTDAKRVLEKVAKIISNSEEIEKMVK